MLAHETAKSRAFGTEHERHVALRGGVGKRAVAVGGERDPPEAHAAEAFEGTRDVNDLDARDEVEGAGGGLRENAGFRGRVPVLNDDRRGSEGGGRAEDGALVVRVGHLIQDDDQPLAGGPQRDFILQVEPHQRLAQKCDPLVDRPLREEAGDGVRSEGLSADFGREQVAGVVGYQDPVDFSPGIGERRLGGMRPVKPETA